MDRGFTLWFTGLSGSGKSTLAQRIASILRGQGRKVEVLEENDVWRNVGVPCDHRTGHGFSRAHLDTSIKRLGYLAKLLTRNGVVVIADAISPYRNVRRWCREQIGEFVEVYVSFHSAELDDYEEPENPEVVVHGPEETVEESVGNILECLRAKGYIPSCKI